MIYGLKKIGKVDWYDWGTDSIIPSQRDDGSWRQNWGNVAGTSFCLLFLNRSNVAPDLTALVGNGKANMKSGTSIEDLRKRVRAAQADQDSNSLLDQLARTENAASQMKMIARLRDEKGAAHSKALAEAIDLLTGEMKEKAREALYKRFLRMTARTLKKKLIAGDPETKLAAAKSAGEKRARRLFPS